MTFLQAIILGLVEGITEFIPVSSTAHLMMASSILKVANSDFLKSFEIVIQFGAIAAVLLVFGPLFGTHHNLWKKIIVAFLPTAVIGFVLYKLIKAFLIGNLIVAVWGLILGGIALIGIEYYLSKRRTDLPKTVVEEITYKQAFFIGVTQSLAIIPGVSRSAATIIPAMLFGTSRRAAAEFSFLLAVPTVAAAAGYDLVKNIDIIDGNVFILIVGFIASFIASAISIKFLLSFIQRFSFISFGIYRIIVAVIFLFLFI